LSAGTIFVVSCLRWTRAGLRDEDGAAAKEVHDGGHVEDVLIVSGEEEDAVGLDGAAESSSELLLAIGRLESKSGLLRVEEAVADEIEAGPVKVIGTGLGNDVHDGTTGSAEFGAISVRRNAELLHNFI